MEHLRKLRQFFRDKDHTFPIPHVNEAMLQHLEDTLLPHLLRVLQKDNTLIAEVELFPGIKCDSLWDGSDDAWKRLQMALLYAVLNGDPKEKFGKIIDTVKGLIPGGGAQSDEISEILNDEENQNSAGDTIMMGRIGRPGIFRLRSNLGVNWQLGNFSTQYTVRPISKPP